MGCWGLIYGIGGVFGGGLGGSPNGPPTGFGAEPRPPKTREQFRALKIEWVLEEFTSRLLKA
jgi:hypothetical protein